MPFSTRSNDDLEMKRIASRSVPLNKKVMRDIHLPLFFPGLDPSDKVQSEAYDAFKDFLSLAQGHNIRTK